MAQYDLKSTAFFDGFTPAKLRAADPCALLHATDLAKYGAPASDTPGELGSCSNFMKDHGGKPFNITLYLQSEAFDVSQHRIGGLPASISADGNPCFVQVAYQGSQGLLSEPQAMQLQLDTKAGDPCSPAVQIMTDVVEKLRANPPIANRSPAELAGIDPCTMLDPVAVRDALGGATADPTPRGLHDCGWTAANDVNVDVKFSSMEPRAEGLPPADLGGVMASVIPSSGFCTVEWEHRRRPGSINGIETVQLTVNNPNNVPMDPCANAVNAARGVKAKLPRG
ncbi:hypothetical protein [Saccharopolyspora taberi]|uniref:hypothetical protein n=1 Tax=Saccharopolyspora taberi TaxID=60895 RepID=UPI0031E0802B